MEKMPTLDRNILLLTGHNGAGKGFFFDYLSTLPEYQGSRVFKTSKDRICRYFFKHRVSGDVPDNQDGYLAIFGVMTPKEKAIVAPKLTANMTSKRKKYLINFITSLY